MCNFWKLRNWPTFATRLLPMMVRFLCGQFKGCSKIQAAHNSYISRTSASWVSDFQRYGSEGFGLRRACVGLLEVGLRLAVIHWLGCVSAL